MPERHVVVLGGSTRTASMSSAFARTAAAHPPAGASVTAFTAPEYAGALPGAFKNALDWLVGSTVMTDRPGAWIAVATDARRGGGAHAELATVLGYVQAQVLASITAAVAAALTATDAQTR